jgi:RNA polymerase sigma-70 factor, ECF subfamily
MHESTEELTERVRRRDPAALGQFLAARRPQLLAYIDSRIGTALRRKLEAEDVLQEVSVEAVRALADADFSQRDPFSWLCQMAEHRVIDAHRHFFGAAKRDAGREVPIAGNSADSQQAGIIDLLVASMTTASKVVSRNAREAKLYEALAQLPEEQRDALRLRYVEGLASKQIAEQLGKSDGAVRVLLTRGLRRLQDLLGPDAAPR